MKKIINSTFERIYTIYSYLKGNKKFIPTQVNPIAIPIAIHHNLMMWILPS